MENNERLMIKPLQTKNQRGDGLCLWFSATSLTEYIIRKKFSRIQALDPYEAFSATFKNGYKDIDIIMSVPEYFGVDFIALEQSGVYDSIKVRQSLLDEIPIPFTFFVHPGGIKLNDFNYINSSNAAPVVKHCCTINGMVDGNILRVQNSFGDSWGKSGHFFISEENLSQVICEIFYIKIK